MAHVKKKSNLIIFLGRDVKAVMLFYFSHNSSIAAPADAEYGRTTKYYEKQSSNYKLQQAASRL